jgi:hypothetical protein
MDARTPFRFCFGAARIMAALALISLMLFLFDQSKRL